MQQWTEHVPLLPNEATDVVRACLEYQQDKELLENCLWVESPEDKS